MLTSSLASAPWHSTVSSSGNPPDSAAMKRPRISEIPRKGRTVGHRARLDVHRERHEITRQRQHDLLRDLLARLVLRLVRARPEVRGDDDVGRSKSGEAVVGSTAKTSIAAPPTRPSRIASASASSSTIPPGRRSRSYPGLGPPRAGPANEPDRVRGLRQMDRDEVAPR